MICSMRQQNIKIIISANARVQNDSETMELELPRGEPTKTLCRVCLPDWEILSVSFYCSKIDRSFVSFVPGSG